MTQKAVSFIGIHQGLLDELFQNTQEEAGPAIWSQGVQLSRLQAKITLTKTFEDGDFVFAFKTSQRPLAQRVVLNFKKMEGDCDCRANTSPCPHVVASLILLKQGIFEESASGDSQNSTQNLNYRFVKTPQGLHFLRFLATATSPDTSSEKTLPFGLKQILGKNNESISASAQDTQIDQIMGGYRGPVLERNRMEALFKILSNDLNLFLDAEKIQISNERLTVQAELIDEADGYRLRRVKNPSINEIFAGGVARCSNTLKLISLYDRNSQAALWIKNDGTFFTIEDEKKLINFVIPEFEKKIPLKIESLKLPRPVEWTPYIHLKIESIPNGDTQGISLVADVVYGEPPQSRLVLETLELQSLVKADVKTALIKRNLDLERKLLMELSKDLQVQAGRPVKYFAQDALAIMQKTAGYSREGLALARYRSIDQELIPDFKIDLSNGEIENLRFQFCVKKESMDSSSGDTPSVNFDKLWEAFQSGALRVQLIDGSWAKIPKDFLKNQGAALKEFLAIKGQKIPKNSYPELQKIFENASVNAPPQLTNFAKALEDPEHLQKSLPLTLKADLRSYQVAGFRWLSFLKSQGLGGLLCDDMGLGKTLQSLSVIEKKTLIAAPTSVIYNWENEIKKFRPDLNVHIYHGGKRVFRTDYDVVLTSHGLLRMDIAQFKSHEWDAFIVDESQTLKNPSSQFAQAVFQIPAKFKLGLSGTPIENKLEELWSQFHFVLPGHLGSREDFKERFNNPILAGEGDKALILKNRIKPFILRRLKKDVAKELPEKIEVLRHCEWEDWEKDFYQSLFATTKSKMMELLEAGNDKMIEALELILRLRQACCHPALIAPKEFEGKTSSKIKLLVQEIKDLIESGSKCLVFSQWTKFLDLIEPALEQEGIGFLRIDGSTQKRAEIVDAFQNKTQNKVLLLSLKAAGVGLNLTAADRVFILDPWWNPAAEDQAVDRAHRIGQNSTVMVSKLIMKDSIEERILELQTQKRELAAQVLDENSLGQGLAGLNSKDLLRLLI